MSYQTDEEIEEAGKHKISVSLLEGDFENTSLESMKIHKVN